jgi:hypothetical protein
MPHRFDYKNAITSASPPDVCALSISTDTGFEQLGAERQFDAEEQGATPEVFIVVCCKISREQGRARQVRGWAQPAVT